MDQHHQHLDDNFHESDAESNNPDGIFTRAFVEAFSPRSKEACLRQGIELEELVFRSFESFRSETLPVKLQQASFEHSSRRRTDLLDLVRQEHQHLVAINWKPKRQLAGSQNSSFIVAKGAGVSPQRPKSSPSASSQLKDPLSSHSEAAEHVDSGQLKMEQARLEKMLLRQQKELEQMVSYEIKIAELNSKQEEKLKIRKEYEESLREQQRVHRLDLEEKKRQFELKKLADSIEEDRRNKVISNEFMKKQRKFEAEEAEREEERKAEIRRKAAERAQKQRLMEERSQQVLEEQFAQVSIKVQNMSVRDRERQRKLDAMKEEQIRLQQQKSGEARQRVMQALDSNERILQQKRDELEDKMQQQMDRMNNFQDAMEKRVEDLRVLQEQKEFKRRETKAAADAEEQRKIDTTNDKLNVGEERKRVLDEEKRQEQYVKSELERLNKEEKLSNVRRIQRMEDYRRREMIAKMNREAERTQLLEDRKRTIIGERKRNQLLAQIEKEKVLAAFQKMKNSTNNTGVIATPLSLTTPQRTQSANPNSGNSAVAKSQSSSILPIVNGASSGTPIVRRPASSGSSAPRSINGSARKA